MKIRTTERWSGPIGSEQICSMCFETQPWLKRHRHGFHATLISSWNIFRHESRYGRCAKNQNGNLRWHLPLGVRPPPPLNGKISRHFFTPLFFFCNWILHIWNGFYIWSQSKISLLSPLIVNNYQSYYVKCSIFMVMKLDHNKIRFHKSDVDKSFKSIHLGQYKICVVWHCALIYIHSISHLNQSRYVSNSSYDKMCTLSLPHTGVSKYVVFKRSTKILS